MNAEERARLTQIGTLIDAGAVVPEEDVLFMYQLIMRLEEKLKGKP